MVDVIWTKKATDQLERAVKYIKEEHDSTYAELVLNRILHSTRNLNVYPQMG
jgi:plasmid stabilization system protein ParE